MNFQIINRGFDSAIIIRLFGLNVVMNGKMFLFDDFLGFGKYFCGIERVFPSLISRHYFLQ